MKKVCTYIAGIGILGIGWLLLAWDLADGKPEPFQIYRGIERIEGTFSGELTIRHAWSARKFQKEVEDKEPLSYYWQPPEKQRERGLLGVVMTSPPAYVLDLLPFPAHKLTFWVRSKEATHSVSERTWFWYYHHTLYALEQAVKDLTVLEKYSISEESWVLPFRLRRYDLYPYYEPDFHLELSLSEHRGGLYGIEPCCNRDECSCCQCRCCRCRQQASGDQKMAARQRRQVLQFAGYLKSREDANFPPAIRGTYYEPRHAKSLAELLEHYGFDFSRPIMLLTLKVVVVELPRENSPIDARSVKKLLAEYLYVVRSPQDVLLLADYRCLRLRNIRIEPPPVSKEMLRDEFLKRYPYASEYSPYSWIEFEGRLTEPPDPTQLPPPGASLVRPIVLRPRVSEQN